MVPASVLKKQQRQRAAFFSLARQLITFLVAALVFSQQARRSHIRRGRLSFPPYRRGAVLSLLAAIPRPTAWRGRERAQARAPQARRLRRRHSAARVPRCRRHVYLEPSGAQARQLGSRIPVHDAAAEAVRDAQRDRRWSDGALSVFSGAPLGRGSVKSSPPTSRHRSSGTARARRYARSTRKRPSPPRCARAARRTPAPWMPTAACGRLPCNPRQTRATFSAHRHSAWRAV